MTDQLLLNALKTNLATQEEFGNAEKVKKLRARIAELEKVDVPKAPTAVATPVKPVAKKAAAKKTAKRRN